jgi:hypothetical protein
MDENEWRFSSMGELLQHAQNKVLDGRTPVSDQDWQKILNYVAQR